MGRELRLQTVCPAICAALPASGTVFQHSLSFVSPAASLHVLSRSKLLLYFVHGVLGKVCIGSTTTAVDLFMGMVPAADAARPAPVLP
jgi:hypothetical protein